jgi:SAM-dependent methyltransferase
MNWKLKAHALAVLSRLPWGTRIYQALQAQLGTNKLNVDESISRALEVVELIREAGADPFKGVYLEIGTGWRPFLPFILHLIGADRIITLDVNRWLNEAYAWETFRALEERLPAIADRLKVKVSDLQRRYEAAKPRSKDSLLQALAVEYRCPGDARRTGLSDESVDFVCSSNVLEHVPPEILRDIHRESLRILRPGGLAVHRFNPGDHACHVDPSVTAVNFLRYSERQWHWYGGSGLAYHNRLRCIQHQSLLEEAGLIVLARVRIDPASVEAIQNGNLVVHPDFARFHPEELAADYMCVVCTRPETIPAMLDNSAGNLMLTGINSPADLL